CIDCDSLAMYCLTCIVESHQHLSLHQIKTWNGRYFEDGSLANAGLVLHLGHAFTSC
ncbi:hypothetical protein M422DRAFT_122255, partial [Sphaerobolus stellatus SS14]